MSVTFTILGCGSSGGVPRVGAGWGACDPANPRNRRRRCSLLIERQEGASSNRAAGRTTVLVDTSPDLREQLLDAGVKGLDAVLFTHEHADHTHGIDDLRVLAIHQRQRIPVYLDEPTARVLRARFRYCFEQAPTSSYPPILHEHRLSPGREVRIDGAGGTLAVLPLAQDHGDIPSLGFRIGGLAYSADLKGLPDATLEQLVGLDVWIVDALRRTPHPSHFSLGDALAWIERVKPRRAILTNMHVDLDYETLRRELPAGVEPAYDGMQIMFTRQEEISSAGAAQRVTC